MQSAIDSSSGQTRFRKTLTLAASGGPPSIGQWLSFPGYTLARTVASLPECAWVLIDCEHGNISDSEMYHSIAAVASAGSSPIVRIAGMENWQIKRALDAGAHGIMVPMCETAEQAREIAKWAHYPNAKGGWDHGKRGVGGLFANAAFGLSAVEYLKQANDLITVIVQIETRNGVENCEAIAAVPGIDALFIGPNDLASSLGYFAFDHAKVPEVQVASERVLNACMAHGKFAGHFSLGAEDAAKRVKQGWQFVNCGADIVALAAWMGGEMGKLKGLVGSGD